MILLTPGVTLPNDDGPAWQWMTKTLLFYLCQYLFECGSPKKNRQNIKKIATLTEIRKVFGMDEIAL